MEALINIALVVRPQGLLGELKVKPFSGDPQKLADFSHVLYQENKQTQRVAILACRCHEGMAYVMLEGVANRDEADKWRGRTLMVDRSALPALPQDEYYINDLVGCEVLDETGLSLGTLNDVLQPGANDVYSIQTPKGTVLIPAIRQVVLAVDVVARQVVVHAERFSEVAVYED